MQSLNPLSFFLPFVFAICYLSAPVDCDCATNVLPQFAIDSKLQRVSVCGRVHANKFCNGDSYLVEEQYTDLRRFSRGYLNEKVSSVQVSPNCTIRLCISVEDKDVCKQYQGGRTNSNSFDLDTRFDNKINWLMCICEETAATAVSPTPTGLITTTAPTATNSRAHQCPPTSVSFPSNGPKQCALVFFDPNCGGNVQGAITSENNRGTSRGLGEFWKDKISSLQVNTQCVLRICTDTHLEGNCKNFRGGAEGQNVALLPSLLNDNVESLSCTCDN